MTHRRPIRSGRFAPLPGLAALWLALAAPAGSQLTSLGNQLLDACASPGVCAPNFLFGSELAAGDFDDDGFDDLAVGVPGETVSGEPNAGAVHIFYGSAAGLTLTGAQVFHQDTSGVAGAPEAGDQFGNALAVGDFDLDGFADLAIGIVGEDIGDVANAGAVAVLFGGVAGLSATGSLFLDQDHLPAGSGESVEAEDAFGAALASDGGVGLAVGAIGEDYFLPTEVSAGLVHVFSRSGAGSALDVVTDREQNDFLTQCGALDGNEFQEFWGGTLAWGRVSDSSPSLIAAGRLESFSGISEAGRATVMFGAFAGCIDQGTSGILDSPEAGDLFGSALATGDFDGDGLDDLAVGVPGESVGSPAVAGAGAINVVYGSPSGPTSSGDQLFSQADFTTTEGLETGDAFGAVLAAGDFDGDGRRDLAIGVPAEDVVFSALNRVDAGLVHVLYGTSGAGLATAGNQTFHQALPGAMLDSPSASDGFGSALAAGDFDGNGVDDLAIGVPGDNPGGNNDAGQVQVVYGLDAATGAFGTAQLVSNLSFSESDLVQFVTVTRSGGAVLPATVDFVRTGGTATPGVDFTFVEGTSGWNAGDLTDKLFAVALHEDTLDEPNETIVVGLTDPSAGLAVGAPASITITIVDDDVAGTLSFTQPVFVAAHENDGDMVIAVVRGGGAASGVTVQYATSGQTAVPGGDYVETSGTLTFAAGETGKTFVVPLLDDGIAEPVEAIGLTLSAPGGGGSLGLFPTAQLLIVDDEIFLDGFESGATGAWSATLGGV